MGAAAAEPLDADTPFEVFVLEEATIVEKLAEELPIVEALGTEPLKVTVLALDVLTVGTSRVVEAPRTVSMVGTPVAASFVAEALPAVAETLRLGEPLGIAVEAFVVDSLVAVPLAVDGILEEPLAAADPFAVLGTLGLVDALALEVALPVEDALAADKDTLILEDTLTVEDRLTVEDALMVEDVATLELATELVVTISSPLEHIPEPLSRAVGTNTAG